MCQKRSGPSTSGTAEAARRRRSGGIWTPQLWTLLLGGRKDWHRCRPHRRSAVLACCAFRGDPIVHGVADGRPLSFRRCSESKPVPCIELSGDAVEESDVELGDQPSEVLHVG